MQVVNKNTPAIQAFSGGGIKTQQVRVTEKVLHFSRALCVTNRIHAGQFMHFINDGPDWKFYVNNDKDGFALINDRWKKGALLLCSAALAHMIRKSTGKLGPVSFPVEPTRLYNEGKKVFMIMTHKPLAVRK